MKKKRILVALAVVCALLCIFPLSAFAITEEEVQAQVDAVGREAVTGNIFVWFLCAIGFLKISQKIDSFMSGLGINVGHTGGSMLAEAMITARGISSARNFVSHKGGSSSSTQSNFTGLKGGLVGMVGRGVTNSAVRNATGTKSGGLGGVAFQSSLNRGGSFASRVIGNVATGSIASTGSITGEKAPAALMSYLGYTAGESTDSPSYTNVEIGGGRITGTEISAEHPEGIAMAMYHTEKYLAPEGDYATVTSADGQTWYKQYAVDAVERTPYKAPDGGVAYHENIVKKLPKAPPRKDKL